MRTVRQPAGAQARQPVCPHCHTTMPRDRAARPSLWRCLVTGNPCGSDTWQKYHPCQCED